MTITDPTDLLQNLDTAFFNRYKGISDHTLPPPHYVEPRPPQDSPTSQASPDDTGAPLTSPTTSNEPAPSTISSKIITLGDFIDTDALSPGFTLTSCVTDEEFGRHVLCYVYPEFREKVKAGQKIVVAGHAMGIGSSRETAVSALKGVGVQAVIARSFAFIYGRNQPSLGLLGIVMEEEDFYAAAKDEVPISIDVPKRIITVGDGGGKKEFRFELSEMEEQLMRNRGVTKSFKKYGKAIWEKLTDGGPEREGHEIPRAEHVNADSRLNW